jgi:hypothetical protein
VGIARKSRRQTVGIIGSKGDIVENKNSFASSILWLVVIGLFVYFVILPRIGDKEVVITVNGGNTSAEQLQYLNPPLPPVVSEPVMSNPQAGPNPNEALAALSGALNELDKALAQCREMERMGKWGNVPFPCQTIEGQIQVVEQQRDSLLRGLGK